MYNVRDGGVVVVAEKNDGKLHQQELPISCFIFLCRRSIINRWNIVDEPNTIGWSRHATNDVGLTHPPSLLSGYNVCHNDKQFK
jgi:hypothetical protein